MAKLRITFFLVIAVLISTIDGRVKISFKLDHYENMGHKQIDGRCCDFRCGACDNRFNLCFDYYNGNNGMSSCGYGSFQTDELFQDNDNFLFPVSLSPSLTNPIILTIPSFQRGFRSKIEVWDNDPWPNAPDKVDFYVRNHAITPDRTASLATAHRITLTGAGSSQMKVIVKVYCDLHFYGTSSGCTTYCVAHDDSSGHYDCNDITGAKTCHPGWEGSDCHVEINECNSNPCQYGARCTDLLNDYRCDCPAGTQGKNCDDIDECQSNPCQNNGICNNHLNYFTCTCPQHYSGVRCEFAIDPCDSVPCLNGATCLGQDNNDIIECACAPGYSGQFCDVDIDECGSVPCMNSGTCMDLVDGFVCICLDGYSGTLCENDVRDECASDPCENSATCVDLIQGYVCVCPPGFHSDNCEEEVNECETNPCVHGECVDEIAGYTCNCSTGYTGTNCSEDIDYCIKNECEHNSTCVDGLTNYTCSCIPGYTGPFCEVDIDECEVSPCVNGRCKEGKVVNNFTCDCTSTGFRGPLCEKDVDECLMGSICPPGSECVNEPGSYRCQELLVTTPLPGLCHTSICYNGGTCKLIDNHRYECVCTEEFTGELCETPTEPCRSNPCLNSGFCRVNTAENGSVSYECRCDEGYTGRNCEMSEPGDKSDLGIIPWYIIVIMVIFVVIIITMASFFVYRHRKRNTRPANDGPTVFSNTRTESVSLPDTLGATATATATATTAPPLPPKGKLGKLGETDHSVFFTNNTYHEIQDPELRRDCALPAPPPYSVI